ncbi:MAG: hypothetical protein JNL11_09535 [Bdellovibrionaceae bacterium]|nr:hypothetical protein [Pseudobdellovibrionaceae bacterium]
MKILILLLVLSSSNVFAALRLDSADFVISDILKQCNGCITDTGYSDVGLVTRYVLNGKVIIRQSDTETYTSITTEVPAYAKVEAFGPVFYFAGVKGRPLRLLNTKGKPLHSVFGSYQGIDLGLAFMVGIKIQPAINENQVVLGLVRFNGESGGAIAQFRKFQLVPGYFSVGSSTQISAGDIKIEKDGTTEKKTMDLKSILETKM